MFGIHSKDLSRKAGDRGHPPQPCILPTAPGRSWFELIPGWVQNRQPWSLVYPAFWRNIAIDTATLLKDDKLCQIITGKGSNYWRNSLGVPQVRRWLRIVHLAQFRTSHLHLWRTTKLGVLSNSVVLHKCKCDVRKWARWTIRSDLLTCGNGTGTGSTGFGGCRGCLLVLVWEASDASKPCPTPNSLRMYACLCRRGGGRSRRGNRGWGWCTTTSSSSVEDSKEA